jgi:putative membrane protein
MPGIPLVALVAALLAAPAGAQLGNPAGWMPAVPMSEPGTPAPNQTNVPDRLFVQLAGQGGMAEVEAAKLAEAKSGNDDVKRLARQLQQDHGKANARLAEHAKQVSVPMPREPAPEHKAERARLESLSGAEFDRAYLQSQIVDHQKTVGLLQWEIGSGQDAQLQQFAKDQLPVVLGHLEIVQGLAASASGAPPQGLAAAGAPRAAPQPDSKRP